MHQQTTAKQVHTFLGLVGYYRKFIKNFAKTTQPLTLLTCQKAKFEWTPVHHTAFLMLKEAVTQAPILCYPDPTKWYIVYTDASDDVCGTHSHKNMMEWNSNSFSLSYLHGHTRENGIPLNRKLTGYILQLQSGTITYREPKLSYAMTTNQLQGF